MRPDRRSAPALVAGLGSVALAAGLGVAHFTAETDPERFAPRARLLGPSAAALADAAEVRMHRGLTRLEDRSRAPAERLGAYRDELVAAERLLVRSLEARPAQASVLGRLAAVRFELDPPLDAQAIGRTLATLELASAMAPAVPRVQVQLGELLLRMARRDEAAGYLRRALDLDPTASARVVRMLADQGFAADEMLEMLGTRAETVVALQDAFFAERREADYLAVLETALDAAGGSPAPALLAAFTTTCLRLGRAGLVLERTGDLGPAASPEAETARLIQRSRARIALGDPSRAVEDAQAAWRLDRSSAWVAEHVGAMRLAAEDPGGAIEAWREALGLVARTDRSRATRARLYRRIGEAEERRGSPARAFDAYRRALELDPEEALALRRVREMEAAAGLGAPGGLNR